MMSISSPALVVGLCLGSPADLEPVGPSGLDDEAPRRTVALVAGGGDALNSGDAVRAGVLTAQHFVRESVSVVVEARWLHFQRAHESTRGGAAVLLGRWYPAPGTVFLEGGVGGVFTGSAIPHDGTARNFSTHLGFGAAIPVARRTRLTGGLRWYHISNGYLSRPNPGWDALYGYVGVEMVLDPGSL